MAAGGKIDNKRKIQTKGHYVCGVISFFYKPL